MRARVQRLTLPAGRRVMAVSDIHGNLPYFKGLLKKTGFGGDDILFIVGDCMEKGRESLATLRYIMALSREYDVHTLCGNCDAWYLLFDVFTRDMAPHLRHYVLTRPESLPAQLCAEAGYPLSPDMDVADMLKTLERLYPAEFAFLRAMPTIIDTERFTFVHGGLPEGPLEELDAAKCMKFDDFLHSGRSFEKWVVVGHWPVMLYRESVVDANPLVDSLRRIVSIDGGCVLKDDGQLNALILPQSGDGFTWEAYDPFPTATAAESRRGSDSSYYIRWGDNVVRVLRPGEEFSLCEHVRTGYRMDILTKYLSEDGGIVRCNDCTDYVLPVRAGDTLSIVETTSRGYFCKRAGVSGWYFGRLL